MRRLSTRWTCGCVTLLAGWPMLSAARAQATTPPPPPPTPVTAAPAVQTAAPNTLTAEEKAAGWKLLFNGKSTAGWRGYRKKTAPAGWQAVDGALTRVAAGGDLITRERFKNFDLTLEWNIPEGGNSGIIWHVSEEAQASYETGPEMQVLDDAKHPDGQSRLTAAGSAFGLYEAPAGLVKPAGQWNAVRILANGAHVEYWMNGTKEFEFELWSDDWNARVAKSKFKQWGLFGLIKKGHIALQDHDGRVAFRNIKIKVLP
jgi:hypothetical protein